MVRLTYSCNAEADQDARAARQEAGKADQQPRGHGQEPPQGGFCQGAQEAARLCARGAHQGAQQGAGVADRAEPVHGGAGARAPRARRRSCAARGRAHWPTCATRRRKSCSWERATSASRARWRRCGARLATSWRPCWTARKNSRRSTRCRACCAVRTRAEPRSAQEAAANMAAVAAAGAVVLTGVDARSFNDAPRLRGQKFDRVVFNFPHSGAQLGPGIVRRRGPTAWRCRRGHQGHRAERAGAPALAQRLLRGRARNAYREPAGRGPRHSQARCECWPRCPARPTCACAGKPYDQWDVPALAVKAGLRVHSGHQFFPHLYPGTRGSG